MNDKIYLERMSRTIAEAYFKEFCFDDAVFLNEQTITRFNYSDQWVVDYLAKKHNCVHLAVMCNDKPIGEILFKRIDPDAGTAVFSIHLQNDSVKGKGYGTCAEKLAINYAFSELKLNVIYADVIKKNQRSIHVLEKIGFQLIKEDDQFMYYKIERLQCLE